MQIRFFLVILFVLSGTNANSSEKAFAWDPTLDYNNVAIKKDDANDRLRFISSFQRRVKPQALYHVSTAVAGDQSPLSQLDAIFTNTSFDKTIFVKFGISPTDSSMQGKFLARSKTEFLYHTKTRSGQPYALYTIGWEQKDLSWIVDQIEFANNEKIDNTRSPANNGSSDSEAIVESSTSPLDDKSTSNKLTTALQDGLQAQYSCIVGTFKGAWDSTGGLVTMVAKGGYKLIRHPIRTTVGIWGDAKKAWDVTKSFVTDFSNVASRLYKNFEQLDPKTRSELSCRIVSAIGVGALVAYFTAGTGAPAALAKIAKAFESLESIPKFGAVLKPLRIASRTKALSEARAAEIAAEATELATAGSAVSASEGFPRLTSAVKQLSSRSKDVQLRAIKEIGDLKINMNSISWGRPVTGQVNGKLMGAVDELIKLIQTTKDVEVQTAAMDALKKYASANSYSYTRGFLGRRAPEALEDLYRDYELPEGIRKAAYDEMSMAYKAVGFGERAPFQSSAALRARDTVDFLGKTYRELTAQQQSAVNWVRSYFGAQSQENKVIVFQSLAKGDGVPKQFIGEIVNGLRLESSNDLYPLAELGFKSKYVGPRQIWTNNSTGAKIVVDNTQSALLATHYTEADTAGMKTAILEGKSYTIEAARKLRSQ